MALKFRTFAIDVPKLFPLTISRGTSGTTRNLFVEVTDGEYTGIGEGAPATGLAPNFADTANIVLAPYFELAQTHRIEEISRDALSNGVEPTALAALDCALWDLAAKRAGVPLYQFLNLPKPRAITTVTIGIEPKDIVQERVPLILNQTGAKALKVKLGSPNGIDHDKEIWDTAQTVSAPFGIVMRADANGGWQPQDAIHMSSWLKSNNCQYIEQPIVKGQEDDLRDIFKYIELPVFLDESIRVAEDVEKFADCCHGVNLKLMKSGGITEGLRVLELARKYNLGTMIGCMCETVVGICQSAAISGLCDYIDLDTHFNHNPEPAEGIDFVDGVVMPRDVPGHGGFIKPEFCQ